MRAFRGQLGLPTRPSLVHCEAVAIKAFMSLIVRRHDGSNKRVSGVAPMNAQTVLKVSFNKPHQHPTSNHLIPISGDVFEDAL